MTSEHSRQAHHARPASAGPRVLLTGGRAPATLDLARLLHAGGCEVHLAESMGASITAWSRAVRRVHRVPPPRQQTAAFLTRIEALHRCLDFDLIVPTCEEVFWLARARDRLPTLCPPLSQLHTLHHKARFIERAATYGLAVPATREVHDARALTDAVVALGGPNAIVLKPAYSRFATSAVVRPTPAQARAIAPTADRPWVVQRVLTGQAFCTWSIAHRGELSAHCCYDVTFSAGAGSAVYFAARARPDARRWVETFVAAEGFTGFIAFDFIQSEGEPLAIECNPRLTSGIHLLSDGPALTRALLAEPGDRRQAVEPDGNASAQLLAPMLIYGLKQARAQGQLGSWWRAIRTGREVSFDRQDPLPSVLQGLSLASLVLVAVRNRQSVLDATTYDIRWDGEA